MRERTSRGSEQIPSPVPHLVLGVVTVAGSCWFLVTGNEVFAALLAVFALMTLMMAAHLRVFRRQRSALGMTRFDATFYRFNWLFLGLVAAAFVAVGLWSRSSDLGDPFITVLAFMLGAPTALAGLGLALLRAYESRTRRKNMPGPT